MRDEAPQAPRCFAMPAAERRNGSNAAVDPQPRDDGWNVRKVYVAAYLEAVGGDARACAAQRSEEVVAQPKQFWTQRTCRGLVPGRDEIDGHHDVALDLQHTALCLCGDACPPCLLRAKIAAVTDDKRGSLGEPDCHLIRCAAADHETDAACLKILCRFGEAFQHKGVVPCIRLRIGISEAETDHEREAQPVRLRNRGFEGGIETQRAAIAASSRGRTRRRTPARHSVARGAAAR